MQAWIVTVVVVADSPVRVAIIATILVVAALVQLLEREVLVLTVMDLLVPEVMVVTVVQLQLAIIILAVAVAVVITVAAAVGALLVFRIAAVVAADLH